MGKVVCITRSTGKGLTILLDDGQVFERVRVEGSDYREDRWEWSSIRLPLECALDPVSETAVKRFKVNPQAPTEKAAIEYLCCILDQLNGPMDYSSYEAATDDAIKQIAALQQASKIQCNDDEEEGDEEPLTEFANDDDSELEEEDEEDMQFTIRSRQGGSIMYWNGGWFKSKEYMDHFDSRHDAEKISKFLKPYKGGRVEVVRV